MNDKRFAGPLGLVFFKRLGRRGFHDLFYRNIFPSHKRYEYFKTAIFSRSFEPRSLDDFHEYKKSVGLYNGKNPVVQLSCC